MEVNGIGSGSGSGCRTCFVAPTRAWCDAADAPVALVAAQLLLQLLLPPMLLPPLLLPPLLPSKSNGERLRQITPPHDKQRTSRLTDIMHSESQRAGHSSLHTFSAKTQLRLSGIPAVDDAMDAAPMRSPALACAGSVDDLHEPTCGHLQMAAIASKSATSRISESHCHCR